MIELVEITPFSGLKETAVFLAAFRMKQAGSSILTPIAEKLPLSEHLDCQKLRLFQASLPSSSLMLLLKQLLADFVLPLSNQFQNVPCFLHPVSIRDSLFTSLHSCSIAERGNVLDALLSVSYNQERQRKACILNNQKKNRMTCVSDMKENKWDGIVIEMAFDKNRGDLVLGRFCPEVPFPIVFFASHEIGEALTEILEEMDTCEQENIKSFFVIPEKKDDPYYVKTWWDNRKRIDSALGKLLLLLESQVMSPFIFLFHSWKSQPAFDQVIEELMAAMHWDDPEFDAILSLFLHCNSVPLSLDSLHHSLQCMSFPAISFPPSLSSLLSRYNQLLPPSFPAAILLCLSPTLQNLPFESIPQLSDDHVLISRHLCLQSIQDQVRQTMLYMNTGHFVINIS